jgi:hypothetical protein
MGFIRLARIWGLCPQTPGIFRFGANPGAEGNRKDPSRNNLEN